VIPRLIDRPDRESLARSRLSSLHCLVGSTFPTIRIHLLVSYLTEEFLWKEIRCVELLWGTQALQVRLSLVFVLTFTASLILTDPNTAKYSHPKCRRPKLLTNIVTPISIYLYFVRFPDLGESEKTYSLAATVNKM
jgi:hypothetical protein